MSSFQRNPNRRRKIQLQDLSMDLCQEQIDDQKWVDIVSFKGRINYRNSYPLNRSIHTELLALCREDIIFDLRALRGVNTVSMIVLFSICQHQEKNKKRFAIGGTHPAIKEILGLVHLPPRMLVLDTIEAAKEALLGS